MAGSKVYRKYGVEPGKGAELVRVAHRGYADKAAQTDERVEAALKRDHPETQRRRRVEVAPQGPNGGTRPGKDVDRVASDASKNRQRREDASRDALDGAGKVLAAEGDVALGRRLEKSGVRSDMGHRDTRQARRGRRGDRREVVGSGVRERNVAHPDGEEHSRVAKGAGGRGARRAG